MMVGMELRQKRGWDQWGTQIPGGWKAALEGIHEGYGVTKQILAAFLIAEAAHALATDDTEFEHRLEAFADIYAKRLRPPGSIPPDEIRQQIVKWLDERRERLGAETVVAAGAAQRSGKGAARSRRTPRRHKRKGA